MEIQNQYPQQDQYVPKNQSIVTIGDWIVTFILMAIPLVNIIMIFVWAFSSSTPVSKANWAKAVLILWLIVFVLAFVFWATIGAFVLTLMGK